MNIYLLFTDILTYRKSDDSIMLNILGLSDPVQLRENDISWHFAEEEHATAMFCWR